MDYTPRMAMKQLSNPRGITVRQLKQAIKDWPEEDLYGEETEVWISTGDCLSSPCGSIHTLNLRTGGGKEWADLLLDPIL